MFGFVHRAHGRAGHTNLCCRAAHDDEGFTPGEIIEEESRYLWRGENSQARCAQCNPGDQSSSLLEKVIEDYDGGSVGETDANSCKVFIHNNKVDNTTDNIILKKIMNG